MERQIRATKREIEATKSIGGDAQDLQNKLRGQMADYKSFSKAAGLKERDNRLRVESGTSNLRKTKTIKWIEEQYKGYTASIPKTWEKTQYIDKETVLGITLSL